MNKHTAENNCFFIAKNPSYHYGELLKDQIINTGQGNLQIFALFDDWRSHLLTDNIITEDQEYINSDWSTSQTTIEK